MLGIIVLLVLSSPVAVSATSPPKPLTHGSALILSSLNTIMPMGYYETYIASRLAYAGYSVTFLKDKIVTVNFLVNQLGSYNIVIWRTNTYIWNHVMYYYVGETVNGVTEQKYAADLSAGSLNANAGIFGVTPSFLSSHLKPSSLSHVNLMVLISSESNLMEPVMLGAGVSSVIFCNGYISLSFGLVDDLTSQLVSYLSSGMNVYNSVYNTVNPYNNQANLLRDPLDEAYSPPFWFGGSSTLTITV
jgi:hypothetical protein